MWIYWLVEAKCCGKDVYRYVSLLACWVLVPASWGGKHAIAHNPAKPSDHLTWPGRKAATQVNKDSIRLGNILGTG